MTSQRPNDDCASCAALCCMAFAFDKSDLFAHDKTAGTACRNLRAGGDCEIHDQLVQEGYRGCVQYSCHGVGPRVVQECFAGATWQADKHLVGPMITTFAMARELHDRAQLLDAARLLPLSDIQEAERDELARRVKFPDTLSTTWLERTTKSGVSRDVDRFVKSLRETASRVRPKH